MSSTCVLLTTIHTLTAFLVTHERYVELGDELELGRKQKEISGNLHRKKNPSTFEKSVSLRRVLQPPYLGITIDRFHQLYKVKESQARPGCIFCLDPVLTHSPSRKSNRNVLFGLRLPQL